jgi:hypothetical protein
MKKKTPRRILYSSFFFKNHENKREEIEKKLCNAYIFYFLNFFPDLFEK